MTEEREICLLDYWEQKRAYHEPQLSRNSNKGKKKTRLETVTERQPSLSSTAKPPAGDHS